MSLFDSITRQILNEDKTTDYIKKLVVNNVDEQYKPYLKTKVSELPYEIKQKLITLGETAYNQCVEHDMNLTHFFRLVFLKYFGLNHGAGPSKYTIGLARIAIEELKMLINEHDPRISKLKEMVKFISENPDLIDKEYDSDLNGLDYRHFNEEVSPAYTEFIESNKENAENIQEVSDYTIVPIYSFKDAHKYGEYTTWCVTQQQNYFNDYTQHGERFYFCLQDGFEKLDAVDDYDEEKAPLDKYGLSMISVLVDMNGNPVHITTRWNHEHGGEDNEGLRTPAQVQEVVKVNFYKTFKPFTEEELEELRANGSYEESEETIRERSLQHRLDTAVQLWQGAALMKPWENWDDYYGAGVVDMDADKFYLYDTTHDEDSYINEEPLTNAPVYSSREDMLAVVPQYNSDKYCIIYNDNYDGLVSIEDVEVYKVIEAPNDITYIFYILDDQIGFADSDGNSLYLDDGFSKFCSDSLLDDFDNKIFINNEISESFLPDGFVIEALANGNIHCLLYVARDEFSTLLKDLPPRGSNQLEYDAENDLIIGAHGRYNLDGLVNDDDNTTNEFWISSIDDHIYDEFYLVTIKNRSGESYSNIIRAENKKLLLPIGIEDIIYGFNKNLIELDYGKTKTLFDLLQLKTITKPHGSFLVSLKNKTIFAYDYTPNSDKNRAKPELNYVIGFENHKEVGPFKNLFTGSDKFNKVVVSDNNNIVNVINTLNGETIHQCLKFGLKSSTDGSETVFFSAKDSSEDIYLYNYKNMTLLDNNPATTRSQFFGSILLYNDKEHIGHTIDLSTGEINLNCPALKNGFQHFYSQYSKKDEFIAVESGNFLYGYHVPSKKFIPTENGIDTTLINQIIVFNENTIRVISEISGKNILFQYFKTNDGNAQIRFKELSGTEPTSFIETSQLNKSVSDNDVDPQIKELAGNIFYPSQKAAVVSAFNEILNKFNKLKGGSILQ